MSSLLCEVEVHGCLFVVTLHQIIAVMKILFQRAKEVEHHMTIS